MNSRFAAILFGCTALASHAAMAQVAAPATPVAPANTNARSFGAAEDIVVTARRRDERLQDVPLAVTALNSAAIERQAIAGLLDVRRAAPSLNISQSAGGGRQIPIFTIRGQRQGDTLASVDPSVGVYVGDQLFKRTYGLDQIIFDMGSIEVLKGPQGTLFGLNTTGGNIVFRPNLPTDNLEASLQLGVGNYDYRAIEGYLNVPLGEVGALRIAGQYKKRDGYIRSVITGQDNQDLDGGGVRATLRLNPTDSFETIFTGSFMKSSTNGTGWRLSTLQQLSGVNGTGVPTGITDTNCQGANPATCSPTSIFGATGYSAAQLNAELAASNSLGFYQTRQSTRNYAKTDPAWNIANTSVLELNDSISLKNIIAYREYKTSFFEDVDGSALTFMEYGNSQRAHEFSEEFQIVGETDELNWIIGAYYSKEHVRASSFNDGLISPRLRGLKTPYTGIEVIDNTSKSIFASGTQQLDNIVEGLSLTLGGRYTWDKRDARFGTIDRLGYAPGDTTGLGTPSAGEGCSFNPIADPNLLLPQYNYDPATCFVDLGKKFSRFTYTATVDWKIAPGKLVYFAHRKGYRAGGFGTRAVNSVQLAPFNQETVYDFEIGAKLDWHFGNGMFLRTNLAAYKQNYDDIQRLVSFLTPEGGVSTNVINAASATIQGLELETTFNPVEWLQLGGFVSHVDPKYNNFFVASPKAGVGTVDIAGVAPFSGVPRWQFGLSGSLTLPTPETFGKTTLQLNYYHQSSFRIQDGPDMTAGGVTRGYGLLNGRLEVADIAGSSLKAALFANNITNKKHHIANYSLASTFGFASSLAGAPRMYGLEVRYTFGQ